MVYFQLLSDYLFSVGQGLTRPTRLLAHRMERLVRSPRPQGVSQPARTRAASVRHRKLIIATFHCRENK